MDELIIVMTTVSDAAIAQIIAQTLVTEKLAACVQIIPNLNSTYMWEGKLCIESEQLIMIKTLGDRYTDLEIKLRSIHPYQEPEIIVIAAISASNGYMQWVTNSLNFLQSDLNQ
ncbi:uncharacterized protein involved in tolerance to divalent cations [Synechococcus sp. PCC 7502]|uniref:divalent-cation tolerance protein CutA n=1 Tax=Synechococcus sp. PCC 7502 TaxID=1173263 RepID=UPI00029FC40D|nr:divalent-cation tolerance protein CutA [Synechococcus sp. PCC 7502]AFY75173.1 uncharacterized protein involved in tolerance to divalent cations [Synechococcus sp. PCC 7502]